MIFDLHTHTKYSIDGTLEPSLLVKIAKKKGFDGIAVTDHNTIQGGIYAKEYETSDFQVIIGSEISTDRGEVIGLFLSEEIGSRCFEDVISQIWDQNGIVIIPHPFDRIRDSALFPDHTDSSYFDAVEGFNSRCIFNKDNVRAQLFAQKYSLCIISGSDAHFANEIGNAGIITPDENVIDAIRRKNINIFGQKTRLLNPLLTKGLKIWRKLKSG
jgi:predicted metal-dependent phosphoesterase TrpH